MRNATQRHIFEAAGKCVDVAEDGVLAAAVRGSPDGSDTDADCRVMIAGPIPPVGRTSIKYRVVSLGARGFHASLFTAPPDALTGPDSGGVYTMLSGGIDCFADGAWGKYGPVIGGFKPDDTIEWAVSAPTGNVTVAVNGGAPTLVFQGTPSRAPLIAAGFYLKPDSSVRIISVETASSDGVRAVFHAGRALRVSHANKYALDRI